ncbi:CU044_5270 family protein [Streptomyces sp. DG2A-72]|uniref:CU044_5270 family protein n=1 Tax=Streptomyces sp. DG2A-72 TaxID=3051386 RepID=UPI00265C58D9|nr:CU044_5270 family protein [Streptomyces sp. DG2A-72]MDO0935453.1 CU044_5270 family protein [Streptomyces sp. DG2A-72]
MNQLPELPERDLPPGRHRLLKEHLMTEIRREDQAARTRARWLLPALGAGAVATVAAVAFTVPFGSSSAPAVSKEAVAVLEGAARGAESGVPYGRIRDDQFVYIKSRVAYMRQVNGGPEKLDPVHTREIWNSVNGSTSGLLEEDIDNNQHVVLEGWQDMTYRDLAELPTDPDEMYDWLCATSAKKVDAEHPDQDEEAFVLFGDLVQESLMPPDVSAALYRAAARIPGVEVVRGVKDAVGREGVAITRQSGRVQVQMIFDEKTSVFLGERELDDDGKVRGISAILDRAIVDKAGQRP